jgi:hypothetical protein
MRREAIGCRLGACVIVLQTLVSCGGSPSSSDVRRAFVDPVLRRDGRALVAVERFEKLNGVRRQDGVYVAECRYVVVFRVSARVLAEKAAGEARRGLDTHLRALGSGSLAGIGGVAQVLDTSLEGVVSWLVLGDFPAGHRLTVEKTIWLERTDKGLRVVGTTEKDSGALEGLPVTRILRSGLLHSDVGEE